MTSEGTGTPGRTPQTARSLEPRAAFVWAAVTRPTRPARSRPPRQAGAPLPARPWWGSQPARHRHAAPTALALAQGSSRRGEGIGSTFCLQQTSTPQAPTSPAFPPATCTSKHTPRCGPCLHSHLVHSLAFNLETQLHWPPPSEPQTAVGRGRRAGSWRGCALMGSGTEPAGCVTPLPGERPLKCVLELARRPSAARRAAVCKGKPSWCPLRASARRRRERLPEASSHWQTGLSRCLANEHSDPQPPKQSGWGGGAALTTAPGPETQAAPPPHGQPPLTYGRLSPLLPSLEMAQNAGSAVWLRWVLNGLQ